MAMVPRDPSWQSDDASATQKLSTSIIYCTGEEEHFPVTELCRPVPNSRGWQSSRQCTYPQQIGFRFDGEVFLDQIQILAHESKIPSRIDVYISQPLEPESSHKIFPPYEQCPFHHLGYVAFRNNQDCKFKSGELRAVKIGCNVLYVKLIIWEPHTNPLNFYEQVALGTLCCIGRMLHVYAPSAIFPHQRSQPGGVMIGQEGDAAAMAGRPVSNRQQRHLTPMDVLQMDLAYDAVVMGKIKELTHMKEKAAQEENFEVAMRIRDQIQALYPLGSQIQQLEQRKKQATLEEDYQLAHTLKTDIEELRAQAAAIRIGPANASRAHQHQHHHLPPPNYSLSPGRLSGGSGSNRSSPTQHQGRYDMNTYYSAPTPLIHRVGALKHSSDAPDLSIRRHQGRGDPVNADFQHHHQQQSSQWPQNAFDEMPAVSTKNRHGEMMSPSFNNADTYGNAASGTGGIVSSPGGGGGAGVQQIDTGAANPVDVTKLMHWDQEMAKHISTQLKNAANTVPDDVTKKAAEYFEFNAISNAVGVYTICCLFSKKHQLREAALTVLAERGDKVLTHCDATALCNAYCDYLQNPGFGVRDPVPTAFFAGMELLLKVCKNELSGEGPQALKNHGVPLIQPLVERTGDSNPRIRDVAHKVLHHMMLCSDGIGVDAVCTAALEHTKGQNQRAFCGRLLVVDDAMNSILAADASPSSTNWSMFPSLGVDVVMPKLVVKGLEHPHNLVREMSIDVLCSLHDRLGMPALERYLTKLKPSLRKTIDERLGKGRKNAPVSYDGEEGVSGSKRKQQYQPPRLKQKLQQVRGDNPPPSPNKQIDGDDDDPAVVHHKAINEMSKEEEQRDHERQVDERKREEEEWFTTQTRRQRKQQIEEEFAVKKPPRRQPPKPVPGECQFCGLADEAFNDLDELIQHFNAECPMLCTCPLCRLPIEIREVHWHLAEDCEFKSKLKQCPHCLRTVRADEYDAHVAKRSCAAFQENEIVCPLCNEKIPGGDSFWEVHIMTPPFCPANPRTST